MIIFFNVTFILGFFLMAIIFLTNQIMFIKIFNRLKIEAPDFLDTKIKKYSYIDARSQVAWKVFSGNFKELKNDGLKRKLIQQRIIMITGLCVFFATIISFVFSKILT